MKKAAGYIRVSRFKNDDQVSPSNQKEKIEMQARILDVKLVRIYQDLDYSGGTDNRPEFRRLIENLDDYDYIIVYKLSRFSRSVLDFHKYMRELDKHNVALVSVSENIDTSTPVGRLIRNVLVDFAQFERETIAETVRDNMHARARQGNWNGGQVPYGYRLESGKLIPDEYQAEVVKKIFNLATKMGTSSIRRELVGVPTSKGGKTWHQSSLARIIRNPFYIGKIHYGEGIYPGEHEPLISEEVFELANSMIDNRGKSASRSLASTHLLSSLIVCPYCGRKLHARYNGRMSGDRIRRYVCPGRSDGMVKCPCPIVDADSLEEKIKELIIDIAKNFDSIGLEKSYANLISEQENGNISQEIALLRNRKNSIESKMKKMFDLYIKEKITETQLEMMNQEYLKEQKAVQEKINELEASKQNSESLKMNILAFGEILKQIPKAWEYTTLEEKKDLIQKVIRKILLTENGVVIHFDFLTRELAAKKERHVFKF